VLDVPCRPDYNPDRSVSGNSKRQLATCPEPETSQVISDDSKTNCGITYDSKNPNTCPSQPPGGLYIYSNWAFSILGGALAAAYDDGSQCPRKKDAPPVLKDWPNHTGPAFIDVIDKVMLKPLQMNKTFTYPSLAVPPPDQGVWYGYGYDSCTKPSDDHPDFPGCALQDDDIAPGSEPAGGIWSTGPDMLVWLKYLMGIKPDDASQKVNDLYALRTLLQCPRADSSNGIGKVGLAWEIFEHDGALFVGKDGAWSGFHAYIGYRPDTAVGAFVMLNSNGYEKTIFEALVDSLSKK
jgi:CubicO group peptidase (beta-lactamase class C family)